MNKITEKLITKSFKRLLDKGIHRGFITYLELSKSLGKRNLSQENLEKALLHIFDNKVSLVEKKSDYKVFRKKESALSSNEKSAEADKSDDPIRMYLREMGGVELLSREGEIAIAKRIEAGKDVMISALAQSPMTANAVFEWKKKLEENQMLVREIIDIDSSYMEIDSEEDSDASTKNKKNEKKLAGEKSKKWLLRNIDNILNLQFKRGIKKQSKINLIIEYLENHFTSTEYDGWSNKYFVSPPRKLTSEKKQKYLKQFHELVLASDGFFPFRDSIDQVARLNVSHVIQPGGSIADESVTEACNEHNICMVNTGVRAFHH